MKKRIILPVLIMLALFLLITMNISLSADTKFEVQIVTNDLKEISGELLGFGLSAQPNLFESYFFVYNKEWKGKHIYFKDKPKLYLPLGEEKKHPYTNKTHRVLVVKMKNKEVNYYINESAWIAYRTKKDKEEGTIKFSDIQEVYIYNRY